MRTPLRYTTGLVALVFLLFAGPALADDPFTATYNGISSVSQSIANQLVPYGFRLLGSLFLIQFTIRNWKSALSGQTDVMALLGKMALSFIWIGFLMFLIDNNFTILNDIFSSFSQLGSTAAGGVQMSPGGIMMTGIALQNNLGAAYNTATGANDGFLNALKYFLPSLMLTFACLGIMISFFVMALAVAIATLEFYLIVAAAPIAYAFGGLDALKQSSIAPLQTVLSIGYRVLILGVIVGVMHGQVAGWDTTFNAIKVNDMTPAWTVLFGCLLGAVASFSAGKIAGALASGQSNISGNEAMFAGLQMMQTIANTMTAGAAAAQLAAGAGNLAADAAGGATQRFAKLSDAMSGGTGSISNAGGGGGGGSGGGGGGSLQAAQSLLGPLGSSPAADSSGGDSGGGGDSEGGGGGSSGDASNAGIGGAAREDEGTASGSDKGSGSSTQSPGSNSQGPSAGAKLGGALMGHIQGMQHESGTVGVNVDVHGKD